MIKILICSVVSIPLLFGHYVVQNNTAVINYSTTAVVTLIGAKILSGQAENVEKYKRKDCPVCKGKGWYISGDGIAKINCQYCEP
jgi:hypothetical protein